MEGSDAVDRYTSELMAAISAALARDPRVAACRERAMAAGLDLRISLRAEAVPLAAGARCSNAGQVTEMVGANPPAGLLPAGSSITDADRRFLRALRIKI
jgi:hypothetical protein